MPEYKVLKPFNTVNRRLVEGTTVDAHDDLSPFNLDERIDNGFLKLAAVSDPQPALIEEAPTADLTTKPRRPQVGPDK